MSSSLPPSSDRTSKDRNAVVMMLAYIEAECRRLGAEAAAHHAALAAALMPETGEGATLLPVAQGASLH